MLLHLFSSFRLPLLLSVAGLIILPLLCISCIERGNPTPSAQALIGSFESEFNRYAEHQSPPGRQHSGSICTVWADTLWQNDRAHRQLLLWADSPIDGLSYEVTPLVGNASAAQLPASAIEIRFPSYVMGDKLALPCGEHPSQREGVRIADALSTLPVTSLTDVQECIKLWLTAHIPDHQPADLYCGSLRVKRAGVTLQTFELRFLVVNKRLPAVADWRFHLDLWQFPFQLAKWCNVTPFTNEYFALIKPFYRKLADTGQKSITTYIKDGAFNKGQTMVRWIKRTDGTWILDFSDFDRYVEHMMEWGIDKQINLFSILGWNPLSVGFHDEATGKASVLTFSSLTDPLFSQVWQVALTQIASHLQGKGWFSKSVIYLDEDTQTNTDLMIALIRHNNPQWKIGLAGRWMSAATEKELYDYSTIWGYNRHSVTNNAVATFYTSCSQTRPNNSVTLQNMGAEMTWMAWHARAKGLNGYLRWAYDYWQKENPMDTRELTNTAGDFEMIYRSSNEATTCIPLSSVRLELLRLGIQDFEKLHMLNDARIEPSLQEFILSSSGGTDDVLRLVKHARAALNVYSVL